MCWHFMVMQRIGRAFAQAGLLACGNNAQLKTSAKVALPAVAGLAAVAAAAKASDDVLHPAQYPWSHSGPFSSFDAKAYVSIVHCGAARHIRAGQLCLPD